MKKLVALMFLLGVSISQPLLAAGQELRPAVSAKVAVVGARFGVFQVSSLGLAGFSPATTVPLKPGQAYGWVIDLKTNQTEVSWKEEFTLPAKPATWGIPEPLGSRSTSSDGRTTTTQRRVSLDRGTIFNAWSVAPGDPAGRYVIRVSVEGLPAQVFEFDVR